ncbi:uncharacterized protein LOC108676633 [Hyalella azteca]|uniref:Uncharacterized protein LOC108676633 n=1 Tax=Hyalella azteca TaxID=294128 RepID=A0A8B7P2I4_HYAAZ|nr:uncharacterized protein LOC108676633 [Hyalella azteca]
MENPSDLSLLMKSLQRTLHRSSVTHRAAAAGACELILTIAQRGLNVDIVCPRCRYSPLHLAAAFGHVQAVYLLCRLGADISKTGMGCLSALGMAARCGHGDVVQVLLLWGAGFQQEHMLLSAVYKNCGPPTTIAIISHGALKYTGKWELHKVLADACLKNETSLVSVLLSCDVCIDFEFTDNDDTVFSFRNRMKFSPAIQRMLFEYQMKVMEPQTPVPMKGWSAVQKRHHRRSRSF